jgi:hypothetical protein
LTQTKHLPLLVRCQAAQSSSRRARAERISLQTIAIQQQSFSDMLIFGPHVRGLNRNMIVTSSNDLIELGTSPNKAIYLAHSQSPGKPRISASAPRR